ncbi:MAG: D-2-hydroxyacid dehydrogenase [Duncaniella sp.]|uniref:D-2-hydroxyacid dehydrogenase n=1 Tax=Duncaniella sp. TaxID=2518496 RepID=UPI0023C4B14C|nr:D-2-hydroxyacid dehydrogenase [Duncaniella sp.]MDE6090662.1 D-2-hydroxyacid dehydrogenase [Duncaniella sp.]
MEKIVILDGYVANSGDLSWDALKEFGELTVYDRTAPDEVLERAKEASVIYTNKVVITDEIMEAIPKLKFIGVLATGYNNVDVEAARRRGIAVCNVPAYSTESVAQVVFAHLLNIVNAIADYAASVNNGEWSENRDFSYRLRPFAELSGLTMGIIGMGNIGRRVAEIARAFGMKVITNSRRELPEGVRRVELEDLFRESDVISLNSALTPATKNIINREALAIMKPTAILINTSRGPLVDEDALAEALREGKIAAAGIDVLCEEPPRSGSPLIGCERCFISPHIAWQSSQARERLINISCDNLKAFCEGTPQNLV